MLKKFFRRRGKEHDIAEALYLTAVAQARQPMFYTDYGVPDSVDGRFELVVVHVFLLLRPLNALAEQDAARAEDGQAGDIAQALFDTLFDDMDRSLREMGVSDIAVGKRVKYMAKAFYGRAAAYEQTLSGSGEELAEALRRNLFGTAAPTPTQVSAMAEYLRHQARHLASLPEARLLSGDALFVPWPPKDVDP